MRTFLIIAALIAAVAAAVTVMMLSAHHAPTPTPVSPRVRSSAVTLITDTTAFDALIARTTLPVIVDFSSVTCPPCVRLAPLFDEAAENARGRLLFVSVDADRVMDLSVRFRIEELPTLLRLEKNSETVRVVGLLDREHLRAWLDTPASVKQP